MGCHTDAVDTAKGPEFHKHHLAAQIGRTHRILAEGPRTGRTEQFTEVAFAADRPEGTILEARIAGHDGARLLA